MLLDVRWTQQQRKTGRFQVDLGTFRKLPLPSLLTPHLLAMAPLHGPPLAGTPAYLIPPPQGSQQPSSTTSSPIPLPTLGLWLASGSHRHPTLLYPGLFQAPSPSLHPGSGVSSTPRPPSPISGKPAASELKPPLPILASPRNQYLSPLFPGHEADYPYPDPRSPAFHTAKWRGHGNTGPSGSPALPSNAFTFPPIPA